MIDSWKQTNGKRLQVVLIILTTIMYYNKILNDIYIYCPFVARELHLEVKCQSYPWSSSTVCQFSNTLFSPIVSNLLKDIHERYSFITKILTIINPVRTGTTRLHYRKNKYIINALYLSRRLFYNISKVTDSI